MSDVVLVPGLWMPGAAMAWLSWRLAARGHATHVFAYRGRESFEANSERLAAYLQQLPRRPTHVVGHSLGGVLVLDALNRHGQIPLGSAVLLGAPVRGCVAGRRLGGGTLGRWMMGGCAPLWRERGARWQRGEPLGVVAGTLGIGLGRAMGPLPQPNDGVVCVDETAVEGMAARALVREGHSMLIFSADVSRLVARFLATGRFE